MERCNDALRARIDDVLGKMVRLVLQDRPLLLAEVEKQLWRLVLALGAIFIEAFLLNQSLRPRPLFYVHAGRDWVLKGDVRTQVGTRFGKVWFRRQAGRRPEAPRAARDLPVDRDLGLVKSFSLGVVTLTARLCAQMAFGNVRDLYADIHDGWAPAPRSVLRIVDAVGAHAEAFVAQAPAPKDDGAVLVVEVDCKGAPMITSRELARRRRSHQRARTGNQRHTRRWRRRQHPRKRRAPGEKSKNAKMCGIGVIYSLKRGKHGLEGPVNKRVYGTFRRLEELFVVLRREVDKRGGQHKEVLFLADAEERIWTLQQSYFPEAKVAVDWWHLVEKLWEAGALVHGAGSAEVAQFVATHSTQLRKGQAAKVAAEMRECLPLLPRSGPGSAWRRKRLTQIVKHFEKWQSHMHYLALRRQDLPISTGIAEGAVRNAATMRLDGPGMRWGLSRANMVLQLRCILINGQWAEFEEYLTHQHLTLAAQPARTQPHDAVEKTRKAA